MRLLPFPSRIVARHANVIDDDLVLPMLAGAAAAASGGKIRLFFTTDDSFGHGPDSADRTWDSKGSKDAAGVVAALHIPPPLLG